MHLQVKKKQKTIIMEIPARDEDGGGEAEQFCCYDSEMRCPQFFCEHKITV